MSKYLPHGSTFSINSVLVGGLVGLSVPARTRGEAESTDSDSGGDREYLAGLREGGTVELTFRHDPDDVGQQQLETNYEAVGQVAIVECVLTLPDDATVASGPRTYTFDGFVTAAPQGDLQLVDDEVAQQTATIKVAGAVAVSP